MANEKPDLYTIRISAVPVASPRTGRKLFGTLLYRVTRKPFIEQCDETTVASAHNLIIRPGDYVAFELDKIELPSKNAKLTVDWKAVTGKEWEDAPRTTGKPGQIPPDAGFACQIYSYTASLDLGVDAELPAQKCNMEGSTVITLDPDVETDEC